MVNTVDDFKMVTRAVQNTADELVTFTNIHPARSLQPLDWHQFKVPPGCYVQLPHGYYKAETPSGLSLIPVMEFYGPTMHKIKQQNAQKFVWTPDNKPLQA